MGISLWKGVGGYRQVPGWYQTGAGPRRWGGGGVQVFTVLMGKSLPAGNQT